MTDKPLWQCSATEVAALTRSGEVSALESVQSAVERQRAVNPDLNAVVVDLGEQALVQARRLDEARAAGETSGPLQGVPITIKINVDQTGQATSNGLPVLKDMIAPADAPIVANLTRAGAVVIGRTNTPEFSFRAETENLLFGQTWNPWGRHISCGGSSGGAGAAVMAGMGALAHGNDIGGSLRFPAMANGAVTVKPGLGRVPAWNPSQKAERGMLAQSMSVQGLIARHARDLHLAMPVMIAPDSRDPYHVPLPWGGDAPEGPIRVGWTDAVPGVDLHPAIAEALDKARTALGDAGYVVETITPPDMATMGEEGYRALLTEVHALMGPDIEAHGSATLRRIFDVYFRRFPPFDHEAYLAMMAKRTHHAREWAMITKRYPLVVTPFLPAPTFSPGRDAEGEAGVEEVLGHAQWSFAMNYIGQPAGYVSTHVADLPHGLVPVGVQIVGRRWREDLIVDAMAAIEDRLGSLADTLWASMT